MAFAGYLIKNSSTTLNNKYIKLESYDTTPNQREEIEAYRDDYTRALTRVTAPGTVSTIEFETINNMELADVTAFKAFFTAATVNALERKVQLTYWNMEEMCYKQTYFYMPDIKFSIRRISGNKMYLKPFVIKLIEYDPLNSTVAS